MNFYESLLYLVTFLLSFRNKISETIQTQNYLRLQWKMSSCATPVYIPTLCQQDTPTFAYSNYWAMVVMYIGTISENHSLQILIINYLKCEANFDCIYQRKIVDFLALLICHSLYLPCCIRNKTNKSISCFLYNDL